MAANQISVLNPANWRPIVQDFLNNILVATAISNTKFEEELVDGDTINFPQMSRPRVQSYEQGTDLSIDAIYASQSQLLINQSKAVLLPIDPVQERQAKAKYALTLARQSAFELANQIDQALLSEGTTNAFSTISAGTLGVESIFSTITNARSKLFRNNATDGELFFVTDPERVALLSQTFVANGFNMADMALQNQFVGETNGFKVYCSNNLPSTQSITIATQPTAGDTITVYGVTFTWTAASSATNPGDISIGADVAAARVNFKDAVNGTGTPGTNTYKDFDTAATIDYRRLLQNQQVTVGTLSTATYPLTAYGRIGGTAVFTSANNFWGTETTKFLAGRVGCMSLGMQMMPTLTITQEPRQLTKNYITHTLYGTKMFSRDTKRAVVITANA